MNDTETILKKIGTLEDRMKVEVTNGKIKKKWINEVVEEIWHDIELIRDLNKAHRITKKYKLYWVLIAIILYMTGTGLKEMVTSLIKSFN
jgi:hypothetical protein